MAEVLAKAEKYINREEALISKKESSSTHKERSRTDKQQGRSLKRQRNRKRSPKKDRVRSPKRRGNIRERLGPPHLELRQRYSPQQYTPLTATVSQVLREVQYEQFLRWPTQMRSDPTKRDNKRYCEFHRDHGHRTDDCIQLRKEIEYLIRHGYLRRFVVSEDQSQAQPPPPRQTTTQHQQPLEEIHVISGRFARGGESSSARKAHLRSIISGEVMEVQAVSKLPRLDTAITFSDSDLEGCQHPHDDPLVIRAVVANKTIQRVLIDNGVQPTLSLRRLLIGLASEGRSWNQSAPTCEDSLERKCYLWDQYSWYSLWETPVPGNNGSEVSYSGCPVCL